MEAQTNGHVPDLAEIEAITGHAIKPKRKAANKTTSSDADRAVKVLDDLRELIAGNSVVDLPTIETMVEESVRQQIDRVIPKVVTIEINRCDSEPVQVSRQHYLFPLIIKLLSIQGLNLCLTGDTGSGKTYAAIKAAEVLGLDCDVIPMSKATTKSDLFGYMSATGNYVATPFYTRFKLGGIYIADEFDACDPGIATLLNAAIANRCLTFPNGEAVEAHESFIFVCCANTTGLGATRQYVGRNRLDAATINRFCMLHVGYDWDLVSSLLGIEKTQESFYLGEGGCYTANEILSDIERFRREIEAKRLDFIISPRDALLAKKLTEHGIGKEWVKKMVFFRGMNDSQINQIGGSL